VRVGATGHGEAGEAARSFEKQPRRFERPEPRVVVRTAVDAGAALARRTRFTSETREWGLKADRLVHLPDSGDGPITVELSELDAWQVRGDFLQARSPDVMLGFLQRTGVFSRTTESGYWTFKDLFGFQVVIRRLMETKPLKWREGMFVHQKILEACIAHRSFQVEFWWAAKSHYAALIANTTLAALLATVHVDHLRGAKFWPCVRCGKQFELTGHRKKYCGDPWRTPTRRRLTGLERNRRKTSDEAWTSHAGRFDGPEPNSSDSFARKPSESTFGAPNLQEALLIRHIGGGLEISTYGVCSKRM
jgi:hypothetical protein